MDSKKGKAWFIVFKDRFLEADISASSVIVAYYLLISLFPLAIAGGNILALFEISPASVLPYIDAILPPAVQTVLNPIIGSLLTSSSGGLLSISAIGLLWSAGRGINYLQKSSNKAYGVSAPDGFFNGFLLKRIISMLVVMLILLLLIVFILVFGIGQALLYNLGELFAWADNLNRYLADFKWPVMLVVLFCILMVMYYVLPDVKLKFRDIWPGAVFAMGGLMLLTQLFTLYMQFLSRSFNSYGALGALFILMFWLNFCCHILLLGAVLNASIFEKKYGKAQMYTGRVDTLLIRLIKKLQKPKGSANTK